MPSPRPILGPIVVAAVPLHVHIDIGYRPQLGADELLAVLRDGFGDRYEVYEAGRLQVPDVMVRRSEREGVAIQILQQRLRRRTRLRVYGLAPSIAQRGWTPLGIAQQARENKTLVEEVARFLEQSDRLHS